jgi:hypothetical protein
MVNFCEDNVSVMIIVRQFCIQNTYSLRLKKDVVLVFLMSIAYIWYFIKKCLLKMVCWYMLLQ